MKKKNLLACSVLIFIFFLIPLVTCKIDNPEATNVSYEELISFLENCNYDEEQGLAQPYWLHNIAEAHGIRTAIVFSKVGDNYWHTFNAFKPTDYSGLLYVDAAMGKPLIAEKEGSDYWARVIIDASTHHVRSQRLGCEKDFLIFWE